MTKPGEVILAEGVEYQPTQPTHTVDKEQRIEELATMPELDAAMSETRVEFQPTQPMENRRQRLAMLQTVRVTAVDGKAWKGAGDQRERQPDQATLPRIFHTPLRWGLPALLAILLIGSSVAGYASLANWLSRIVSPSPVPTSTTHASVIITHPRRIPTYSQVIDLEMQHFMQTFLKKDWATLWSTLASAAQQLYSGESDFAHFEQAKYGEVSFTSYSAGRAEIVQPWLDPDTTQLYPLATVVPVALDASASPGVLSALSIADLKNGLLHDTTLAMVPHNGGWQVVIAGPADIDAPILVPASPPATKLLVPIFMYHHVSNVQTTDALDYSLTVTTTDFNAQLDWLHQQGYTSIDMTELFDALYYGKALPLHPMILTFDDGYADMYTDALPALLAHHDRGVFYIITGMIGGGYLTWSQVQILRDEGMQIASHTVHHVNIGQPPYYTSTQDELTQSKETLQKELGLPIQFFCYPSGEPFHHDSVAEQQIVLQDLYNDGYIGATLDPFSFDSTIQDAQTPYQLTRIRVSGGEPLTAFTGILTSVLANDAGLISQQPAG